MTRLQLVGIVVALSVSSAPSGAAQGVPADAQEIEAYRLTLPALKTVANVNRALVQEMMKDPAMREALKLRAAIETLARKDDLTEAEAQRLDELEARMERLEEEVNPLAGEAASLAEMDARIRKFPPLMRALQREGMEPREYATFWLAFMQAAFVHGFQKSGLLKEVPAGVNMENVRFVAEHAEAIEAMQQELEALGRAR